ncbi:MAG: hypothetical protein DHS80DRAFT_31113 [Piptocephalis tieghemiana]|nr:MAG: hypothetical protein DHS80DRAFT_31113 [Piptocephalis tieghemiana]
MHYISTIMLATVALLAELSSVQVQGADLPQTLQDAFQNTTLTYNIMSLYGEPASLTCVPGNPSADDDGTGHCRSEIGFDKINQFTYNAVFGLVKEVNSAGYRQGGWINTMGDTSKAFSEGPDGNITMADINDQLPQFSLQYFKIQLDDPWLGEQTLYPFQLGIGPGSGKCLASRGVEGGIQRPYVTLITRPCNPSGLQQGNDWKLDSKSPTNPTRLWLSTLFLETYDSYGRSHINSLGDILLGYWTCLDVTGRVVPSQDRSFNTFRHTPPSRALASLLSSNGQGNTWESYFPAFVKT